MVIKSRPMPPPSKDPEFVIDLSQFDDDVEVLRKTTQGVNENEIEYVEYTYIEYNFDDALFESGTSDEDDAGLIP